VNFFYFNNFFLFDQILYLTVKLQYKFNSNFFSFDGIFAEIFVRLRKTFGVFFHATFYSFDEDAQNIQN